MHGRGGEDTLWGDVGADFLSGGAGNDRLDGGGIGNVLYGDDGNDTLVYNPGSLALVPGIDYGAQRMEGGRGYDTLRVGADAYFVEPGGARTPAQLDVVATAGGGAIYFVQTNNQWYVPAGTFGGIERFEFTSPTDAIFSSPGAVVDAVGLVEGTDYFFH
jgi:Ca2+-binding RTX toxin-like protein